MNTGRDESGTARGAGTLPGEPDALRGSGLRVAIFGGAFDPIHRGHLTLAGAAVEQFKLDRLLLVPAVNPPHKKLVAGYEDRFRMIELAVRDHPKLIASRLDAGREHSYSIDTIEKVRRELPPSTSLYFLIGADAFADIRTWVRWTDVIASVEFVIASRPGYQYRVPEGATVHRMDWLELPMSSSGIRARLQNGESPSELPPAVLHYIREHHLYTS